MKPGPSWFGQFSTPRKGLQTLHTLITYLTDYKSYNILPAENIRKITAKTTSRDKDVCTELYEYHVSRSRTTKGLKEHHPNHNWKRLRFI